MSKLITSSLFGSIDWYRNAPDSWKEKAYQDLYNTLARKYGPMQPAAQRGKDFEDHIYRIIKAKRDINTVKCSEKFKEFLLACEGGQFQFKSKSFIKVDEVEYCLYGKIDVLFPDTILDIKTTGKWDQFSEAKYLSSMQHIIYLYNQDMKRFQYMIAVFNSSSDTVIKEIKILNYFEANQEVLKEKIIMAIRKQTEFLKEHPVLKDLYNKTFSKY